LILGAEPHSVCRKRLTLCYDDREFADKRGIQMQPLPPMTATFPLMVAPTIAAPGHAANRPLDTVGAVDLDRTPQPEAGGER